MPAGHFGFELDAAALKPVIQARALFSERFFQLLLQRPDLAGDAVYVDHTCRIGVRLSPRLDCAQVTSLAVDQGVLRQAREGSFHADGRGKQPNQ